MTTRTWNGSTAALTNPADWTPAGAPQPGDTLVINAGTARASHLHLNKLNIELNGPVANAPVLELDGVKIGADTTIALSNDTPPVFNFTAAADIIAAGRNLNAGTILSAPNTPFNVTATLTIDIVPGAHGRPGTLVNQGTIGENYVGTLLIHGAPHTQLVNDGTLKLSGQATLAAAIDGCGTIDIGPDIIAGPLLFVPALTVDAPVGHGQTLQFIGPSSGGGGEVTLTDPGSFHALIRNFINAPDPFTPGLDDESITLAGIDVTSFSYKGDATHGVLTLDAGGSVAARLRFAGDYTTSSFDVATSAAGSTITVHP